MNKTKKLTQGAMLMAIFGALVLIDRITAYWFTEFVVLVSPIVIIMYSAMYTLKDGILLSVGIAVLSFILGNFNTVYLIYIPVGIVTGLAYSFTLTKTENKTTLLLVAIATYAISEIIVSYVVYPIIGLPISQQLSELCLMFEEIKNSSGIDYTKTFEMAGIDFSTLLILLFAISIVIVGIMEGFIIHVLVIFMMKRFRIKNIENTNIWNIKSNPVLAYICFGSLFLLFLNRYIDNQVYKYASVIISMLGTIVLLFYGYIYLVLYGKLVLKRNIGTLVILISLFVPAVIIGLTIIGFLYAAGPLRKQLEEKVKIINE